MTWLYFALYACLLTVICSGLMIYFTIVDAVHRWRQREIDDVPRTMGRHGRNPGDGQKDS